MVLRKEKTCNTYEKGILSVCVLIEGLFSKLESINFLLSLLKVLFSF